MSIRPRGAYRVKLTEKQRLGMIKILEDMGRTLKHLERSVGQLEKSPPAMVRRGLAKLQRLKGNSPDHRGLF
jgi:hypothetical protein